MDLGFAPKIKIRHLNQRDSTSPVGAEKIFRFALAPNHLHIPRHPGSPRGAYRDRHGR
jgi:hypothetical protein